MPDFPILSRTVCLTTSEGESRPISQHLAESDDNFPKRNARNTEIVASDWRAEAEARGRAAFEAAVAEPQTTAEPLAWLWRSEDRERRPQGSLSRPLALARGYRGQK